MREVQLKMDSIVWSVILIITFLLYPFAAAILSLFLIANKRAIKASIICLISFAGLYGYTYLTYNNDDLTRHYYFFTQIAHINNVNDFIRYEVLNIRPDFIIDFIYYILSRFSDNHQLVSFFGAATFYGLILGICLNWLSQFKETNYKAAFFLLIFALLALTPSNEFNGMRQGNANALFIYILTLKKFNNFSTIKKYVLLTIPALIHFSLIPFIALYWIASKFSYKKTIIIVVIFAIMGLIINPFLQFVSGILPSFGFIGVAVSSKIESYTTGEIETELYLGSRIRFYLILLLTILFPLLINILKPNKYNTNKNLFIFFKFALLTFGYVLLVSQTYVLSRALMFFKIILCLLICFIGFNISITPHKRTINKFVMCLISISGIVFLIQAKEYRVINPEIFYKSLSSILDITTNINGYSF